MTGLRRGILLVSIPAIALGTLMMTSAKPKAKKRDAAAIALFDAIKKKGWYRSSRFFASPLRDIPSFLPAQTTSLSRSLHLIAAMGYHGRIGFWGETYRERGEMPRVLLGRHIHVQDEIIIEAVQRGDRDAFASSVERYHGAVYGYLRARLLEPADAEDLTQEVFLRCCQGKARFDSSAMILPWLVGVARNVLREHIRKMIRRNEVA